MDQIVARGTAEALFDRVARGPLRRRGGEDRFPAAGPAVVARVTTARCCAAGTVYHPPVTTSRSSDDPRSRLGPCENPKCTSAPYARRAGPSTSRRRATALPASLARRAGPQRRAPPSASFDAPHTLSSRIVHHTRRRNREAAAPRPPSSIHWALCKAERSGSPALYANKPALGRRRRATTNGSRMAKLGKSFKGRPAGLVFEKKPAATVPATKTTKTKKKPKRPKNYAMRPTTATLARRTTKFEERKPAPPPSYLGLKGRARGPSRSTTGPSRGAACPARSTPRSSTRNGSYEARTRGNGLAVRRPSLGKQRGTRTWRRGDAPTAALGVAAERAA